MPANKGRPSFGGQLLTVPTPLPDDDESKPVEKSVSTIEELPPPAKSTEPEPAAEEPAPPSELTSAVSDEHAVPETRSARPSRERAPGTIRLDDKAGQALWGAYLEAKIQDPFLSYRQFASRVVLDGLATHHRRQKRST